MSTSDDRLDHLLDAWGQQQRLPPSEADGILRSILQEPRASLPVTWWSDLSAQVTAAVVLANSRPGFPSGQPGYGALAAA